MFTTFLLPWKVSAGRKADCSAGTGRITRFAASSSATTFRVWVVSSDMVYVFCSRKANKQSEGRGAFLEARLLLAPLERSLEHNHLPDNVTLACGDFGRSKHGLSDVSYQET